MIAISIYEKIIIDSYPARITVINQHEKIYHVFFDEDKIKKIFKTNGYMVDVDNRLITPLMPNGKRLSGTVRFFEQIMDATPIFYKELI